MLYKILQVLFFFNLLFPGLHAQKSKQDSGRIQVLIDSLNITPNSEQAFQWSDELLTLSEQENSEEGIIIALTYQGDYYDAVRAPEQSLNTHKELYDFALASQDEESMFDALYGMGWACLNMNTYDEAADYFFDCKELSKEQKDTFALMISYDGLGCAYDGKGEYTQALEYFLEAERLAELGGYDWESNIAQTYVKTGRTDLAITLFEKSLRKEEQEKDSIEFANSYLDLGYAYQEDGDYQKARIYYDSSFYYADKFSLDAIKVITYQRYAELHELTQNYEQSILYFKKYQELNETLSAYRLKRHTNALEKRFQKERREKQLLVQRERIQKLWFGIAGLVAIMTIVTLIFLKKREKVKQALREKEMNEKLMQSELSNKELKAQKLETELKNQQADLTNLALDISRKNKFSNELINQLEQLQKAKPDQLKSGLRSSIMFVNNNLRISEDLEQLQMNITEINQTFYRTLDAKFEGLSANDKYVLGLIRLNLSNKDIATIKNISLGSAKTARHRLRQKLKLSPDVDLVRFLQEI